MTGGPVLAAQQYVLSPEPQPEDPDLQNFVDSIVDELRSSGVPESGCPFSVESFRRSVAHLSSRPGAGDFDKMVEDIHTLAARGKKMLEVVKSLSSQGRDQPSAAAGSAQQTQLPSRGIGSGARGGAGEREPSPARSVMSIASSASGGPAAKRARTTSATDASQGATPLGDDSHLAVLGEGIANAMQSRSGSLLEWRNIFLKFSM